MITFFTIIYVIVCVILILVILLQSSKAASMGIFGGSASQTPFGSRSHDVLAKFTTIVGVIFMLGAFALAIIQSRQPSLVIQKIEEKRSEQQAPQPEQEQELPQFQPATNAKNP